MCARGQEIGSRFAGWGPKLQSSVIAVIAVNLLAGPPICKFALRAAGEAGAAGEEPAMDADGITAGRSEVAGDEAGDGCGGYGELDSDYGPSRPGSKPGSRPGSRLGGDEEGRSELRRRRARCAGRRSIHAATSDGCAGRPVHVEAFFRV